MVNEEARKERHAKLKQENIQLQSASPKVGSFGNLRASLQQICRNQNNNPLVGKLLRKILGFTMIFALISPFIATYQLTEGSYIGQPADEGAVDVSEFTNQNAEKTIADVMTEDGFLLKPAISSAAADRSGFSEIFVYTVEPGDTLSSIAQSFNLKKETIMSENNLWDANRLKVGSQIKILPVDGISYVVKKGDTVDKLAKKYKVEKGTIISQNQLEDETLVADKVLIIPGAKRDDPVYVASSAPAAAANYSGPKAAGRLIWPAVGKITQGYRNGHLAIDIGNRNKGAIFAATSGKVIKAETSGWNGGYGNVVIIDHGNGMQTLYAHNEKVYVKVGQYVEQGQTIAWMGRTGRVYGPTGIHSHFEVRINGVKYNPMNFF